MIILRYHGDFLRLTASAAMPGHLGAVSLKKKSHDIVILSFCNTVKGQANNVQCTPLELGNFYIALPFFSL